MNSDTLFRNREKTWQPVLAGIELLRDSCNVYAVPGPSGTVFINAGTGAWLSQMPERFPMPHYLLCTHHFRDHAAGAAAAHRHGMSVLVPKGDLEALRDPGQFFRERQNYIVYDNIWDNFLPIEGCGAEGLADYGKLALAGHEIDVVPLPGVTPHHTGFALCIPGNGTRVLFCGEAIHSKGRMARLAPLQYDYTDLGGAVNAFYSAEQMRMNNYDVLLPSLGEPILADCDAALGSLQNSLRRLCAGRPVESALLERINDDRLLRVTDHVWMSLRSEAVSWVLVSDSGKAMVIDYGYRGGFGGLPQPVAGKYWQWPSYPSRQRRRPLLHTVGPLKSQLGIDKIDVVLLGHFHDDHVAGAPLLQRLFGTECWVPENFAKLLAHPEAHRFPCNWPEPIKIDRELSLNETFRWEEYEFRLAPMSGHTRFSAAVCFDADGKRFAHTGDQYFFWDYGTSQQKEWAEAQIMQSHVYRNGAYLDSYRKSAEILTAWSPDIILTGHTPPMHTDADFFTKITAWGRELEDLHREAAALGDDDIHFGVDGMSGWIWPYRVHRAGVESFEVEVTVRNPFPHAADLSVSLVGPAGWTGSSATVQAQGRGEVSCRLSMIPSGPCRRQPIAAAVTIDGRPFGQIAEALVTLGHEYF